MMCHEHINKLIHEHNEQNTRSISEGSSHVLIILNTYWISLDGSDRGLVAGVVRG
jgi:hypothetical protein